MTGHHTDLERLLTDALEAKAATITAADLRPAAPPSGPRRAGRRRLRWAVLAPPALAAAVLTGWLILATGQPRPHPDQPATPPPASTPSTPSPSPRAPSPTPTPTPSQGSAVSEGPSALPNGFPSQSAIATTPSKGTTPQPAP